MREVSKDQFYERIGPLNVFLRIVGDKYPYKTEFRMQSSHEVVGYIQGTGNSRGEMYKYYTLH